MGLLDLIIGRRGNSTQEVETKNIRGVEVKVLEIGTTGTEIYSGYLQEEYLRELTGQDWADKVDMMRRSDANVRMVLNAIKLPLKSSPWTIDVVEQSESAEFQKKLFERILFEDLNKSFTQLVGEILTCLDFGYSLFDITHAVKTNSELGSYTGLKSLAYRSQRTIERWNLDQSCDLKTVTQMANGDEGGSFELDARFLLHFAPEREGDNFEGISVLRACYGPWFRKNEFLKKLAIGIEKFAVPTAVLTVPEGTEGKPEMAQAKKALACYTSGATNYLILPKGFELSFNNVSVDVEKIRAAINAENQEMVNSILASFLLLGQNGAGSLALSGTLSDFFTQTVQYIADHISEQFERKIFRPLVKMNFGTDQVLVTLKCDGLEHRANEAWANMVNGFISSGAIKADADLEDTLRDKLKLPPKLEIETPAPTMMEPVRLAEKKKTTEPAPARLIRKTADRIRRTSRGMLPFLAKKYIHSVLMQKQKAAPSFQIKAPLNAQNSPITGYSGVLYALGALAKIEADEVQYKVFKGTRTLAEFRLGNLKLKRVMAAVDDLEAALKTLSDAQAENEIEQAAADLVRIAQKSGSIFSDYLSPAQKQSVRAKADVFAETQRNDIQKAVDLQYQSSLAYADDDQLEQDMLDAADKVISGPMTTAGPDVQASQTVNDGLMEAAEKYAEETGDEIISYTYVAKDDDRTTDLCREMDGATFAANDPALLKHSPPLHFNCRSFMQVNTSRTANNPKITGAPRLSKEAQKQFQLADQNQPTFELAEYKGRQVELNKPFRTPEGPKKFGVYTKNEKGNVVLVRFGDPNLEIKRDDPERRKNFRARHQCDTDPGPKWKARYWSCKFWSTENVGDLI